MNTIYWVMITFILGRSGSGKTHLVLEEIKQELKACSDGDPMIFLLPEQATFQAEQAILSDPAIAGMTRCEVLSFSSLAHRIFSYAGLPRKEPLSEVGKLLLLNRAYLKVVDSFKVLPKNMSHNEISQVGRGIFQFIRHAQTAESLLALSKKIPDLSLSLKLADLSSFLDAYLSVLSETQNDQDLLLTRMLSVLDKSDYLNNAKIWVDSFAEFSGQERKVLKALARRVNHLKIALLMDPSVELSDDHGIEDFELFGSVRKTYNILLKDFQEEGIEVAPPVCLKNSSKRFRSFRELEFLEDNIFQRIDPGYSKHKSYGYCGRPESIQVVSCTTPRKEADCAVRKVLELVVEKGLRYRDIAIITRNLDAWHDLLSACLSEHKIPFFIDRRRSLRHHPFVEYLSVLGDMLLDDFAPESMRRFLKTGLTILTDEESDILENHLLRCGLRGSKWWNSDLAVGVGEAIGARRKLPEVQQAEKLRLCLSESLAPWRDHMTSSFNSLKWAEILYLFARDSGAIDKLIGWAEKAEEENDLKAAQEHKQVAGNFKKLLDEVASASGTEDLSAGEFFTLLNIGLSGWDLGFTPPLLDQVLVGGIDRSRHPELRAVLLLGFNDGSFPSSIKEDPLLSDTELAFLSRAGFNSWKGTRERILSERLLAYIAFTRASDFLYISYSETDSTGRRIFPSPFLNDLFSLFPGLKIERPATGLYLATTPERVAEGYLQAKSENHESSSWGELIRLLKQDKNLDECLNKSFSAAHRDMPMERIPIEKSDSLTVWVTELETFAKCPFRHFAGYRLNLKERDEFLLGGREIGTLRHAVLEWFAKELIKQKRMIFDLNEGEVEEFLSGALDSVLKASRRKKFKGNSFMNYQIERVSTELKMFLKSRRFIEQRGSWHPFGVEFSFSPKGGLPPINYRFKSGVASVQGKIDRIDFTEDSSGSPYLCLYDFKTSYKYSFDKIYHGISLQLPLYFKALKDGAEGLLGRKAIICGAFFQNTRLHLSPADGPGDITEEGVVSRFKPKGFLTAEGLGIFEPGVLEKGGRSSIFQAMIKKNGEIGDRNRSNLFTKEELDLFLEHVNGKVQELLDGIADGRAAPSPCMYRHESACNNCCFSALCRFDIVLDRRRFRRMEPLGVNAILSLLNSAGCNEKENCGKSDSNPGSQEPASNSASEKSVSGKKEGGL